MMSIKNITFLAGLPYGTLGCGSGRGILEYILPNQGRVFRVAPDFKAPFLLATRLSSQNSLEQFK